MVDAGTIGYDQEKQDELSMSQSQSTCSSRGGLILKISSQVYVKGSLDAVDRYCRAFGLEKVLEIKNEAENEYMHCELMRDGQLFMAVSEAPKDCDTSPKTSWQTMAFNVYDMGSEEAVQQAYDILQEGGTVIDPPGPCDWNAYCSNVIDRFGVFWWIAI
ncbi:glyoxalase/bleomycin resistance/extradiol dioxygenase family protein [Paenibacillus sp. J53TS2]|uniref:VOC family protein n=1 Tax=Paenibacillus sp. J53TS2 TaxID=2807197 RepID=UPI001BCC908F|nr:VOC family protein [Paenibacillus sp. J53TS2]